MTKGVTVGEEKIEVRLPSALKRQAETAAREHGDGNVSAWVRSLIRDKLRDLGIAETEAAPKRGRKGGGR